MSPKWSPKRGPFFVGQDRASRVGSAPRGLGLYRRSGRDGFFFIKNLAAQAKRHPGRIKPAYIDEQIRRSDGALVTSQKEAETYCHRRNAQIKDMLLALEGETVNYSGADLEAIAQQLASQWLNNKQRGVNLQGFEAERLRTLARWGARRVADWMRKCGSGGLIVWTSDPTGERLKQRPLSADEIEDHARKIEQLCWDIGYRPNEAGMDVIVRRFGTLVAEHADIAIEARRRGELKPPKPAPDHRSITWKGLLKAKEEEGIAAGTLSGMSKAVERLAEWFEATHAVLLPASLDGDLAKSYRTWLYSVESGLSHASVGKELRYLNSVFNAAVKQQLLGENPLRNLPKDRRSAMQQKLDARKTVDANKVLSADQAMAIYRRMHCDMRGHRDVGFDLFYLQAVTGTRIQEVAGLRGCDFTERRYGNDTYKCIEIVRWSKRGLGVMGERGGLKNPQSERIIPLPRGAEAMWAKHAEPNNRLPAFPDEQPKSIRGHWGDNLARRMRDKIPDFPGTHAWRETLINNLLNSSVPVRIVEMITGKTGNTPLSQYTSDDLPSMAKAIEIHANYLNLPPCL